MPLNDLRSILFPYCMRRRDDGTYEFLNREYQPLGFNEQGHGTRADLPIYSHVKGLTKARAAKISYSGSDSIDRIYLYNDGCVPTHSAADMKAYLDRLAVLAKLQVDHTKPPKRRRKAGDQ